MKRDNSSKKSIFCSIGYVDYILLASSISIALGEELSADDLNILATFFAVLSDELALISAIEETCSSGDNGEDTNFTAPVPAVAESSRNSKSQIKCSNIKKRKRKVIRKKIKKK